MQVDTVTEPTGPQQSPQDPSRQRLSTADWVAEPTGPQQAKAENCGLGLLTS